MTKLVQALALVAVGLVAVAVAGPALARLVSALVPLVVASGFVASLWQLVRYFTRQ